MAADEVYVPPVEVEFVVEVTTTFTYKDSFGPTTTVADIHAAKAKVAHEIEKKVRNLIMNGSTTAKELGTPRFQTYCVETHMNERK